MILPLKQLRKKKGITQLGLSKTLRVAPSTVGMWEQGQREPDYEMLIKIADYFKVSIDYLLGRDNEGRSLSEEQKALLLVFDSLNDEGQDTLMKVLNSLGISHSKYQRMSKVVQKNSGGTNFLATGGKNNYRIVTS